MDQASMGRLTIPVGPVFVDLIDDDRICKSILGGKPFEPKSLAAWVEMCEPNTTVIDVGAYSGLFSIAAAKLGVHRAIALEPLPAMAKRLAYNIKINKVVDTVIVIEAAAATENGVARLGYNDEVELTSGASMLRKSRAGIDVTTIPLDEIRYADVSAIKIDVEHYEIQVLKGAMRLLDEQKPKLLIETLTPAAKVSVEKLLINYRTVELLDDRNLLMEPR